MKIIVADKISERGIALLRETGWEIVSPAAAVLPGRNRECGRVGGAQRDESDVATCSIGLQNYAWWAAPELALTTWTWRRPRIAACW